MIKKFFTFILVFFILLSGACISRADAADYGKKLTLSERNRLCNELKSARQQRSASPQNSSVGGGIIPDAALNSIYNTTRQISDAMSLVLVLGHALTCNAVHANKNSVTILGLTLFSYPNIPVWLCGAIIYFMGFMMTLSITFYLVDISFKLGFAVIMLPIGVALWPFPPTKDRLSMLIGIILKSAAIFVFLAMTVSYALNLLNTATGDLESVFQRINNNETDTISEDFALASSFFMIVMFALVYGMKLIGSTIEDYAGKFFKDGAFGNGKNASPMHRSLTQAMDFAVKKAVSPTVSWARDAALTQAGRATAGAGRILNGKALQQFQGKSLGEAAEMITNQAGGAVARGYTKAAHAASSFATGTLGRLVLGKNASENLQEKLDSKIEDGADAIRNKTAQIAGDVGRHLPSSNSQNSGSGSNTGTNASVAKKWTKGAVKGLAHFAGNILETVGSNMQRHKKKKGNMIDRYYEAQQAEEELQEEKERKSKYTSDD